MHSPVRCEGLAKKQNKVHYEITLINVRVCHIRFSLDFSITGMVKKNTQIFSNIYIYF